MASTSPTQQVICTIVKSSYRKCSETSDHYTTWSTKQSRQFTQRNKLSLWVMQKTMQQDDGAEDNYCHYLRWHSMLSSQTTQKKNAIDLFPPATFSEMKPSTSLNIFVACAEGISFFWTSASTTSLFESRLGSASLANQRLFSQILPSPDRRVILVTQRARITAERSCYVVKKRTCARVVHIF